MYSRYILSVGMYHYKLGWMTLYLNFIYWNRYGNYTAILYVGHFQILTL